MAIVEQDKSIQVSTDEIELLQQSIIRLAGSRFANLQSLIEQIRADLKNLDQQNEALQQELAAANAQSQLELKQLEGRTAEKLTAVNATITESGDQSKQRDGDLAQRARELSQSLQENRRQIDDFKQIVKDFGETINQRIDSQEHRLLSRIEQLQSSVNNPTEVLERTMPVTISLLADNAQTHTQATADALAPIMGQAIERQITAQPQVMVDAMSPIMLQAVNSSIAQQMRELVRTIDERRREAFDFRRQANRVMSRVKGVSEAEMMLRDALPYEVERVFLIHRETSLLLSSVSKEKRETSDLDMVSSMLSAIRDFAGEAFGTAGDGDLEEISHAGKRILLEAGSYAYMAVVVDGIEPQGYSQFMVSRIADLHIHHLQALKNFDGNMSNLPDFVSELRPLLDPNSETLGYDAVTKNVTNTKGLSRAQKWALAGMSFVLISCLAVSILAGIYAYQLWPLVFGTG